MYNTYLLTNGHWTWVTSWDAERYRKVEPIVRDDGRIKFIKEATHETKEI